MKRRPVSLVNNTIPAKIAIGKIPSFGHFSLILKDTIGPLYIFPFYNFIFLDYIIYLFFCLYIYFC